MVSFLTVRDIMLLIYTLEALYALSDLGRYACDKIVSVHRCIGNIYFNVTDMLTLPCIGAMYEIALKNNSHAIMFNCNIAKFKYSRLPLNRPPFNRISALTGRSTFD